MYNSVQYGFIFTSSMLGNQCKISWNNIIIIIIIIIIILSFDIAPFPYEHAQRRITFHCQRIDVDMHLVNWYIHL